MPIAKRWPNGTKLSIRFIGGTPEMHEKVKAVASEWMKHANIEFSFDNAPGAAIRIGFVQGDGSWSYVGTDNLDVAGHARTMNFGWALEDGTILHEFGHMLGLAHEHSNPEGGIQWNEPVVIDALSRAPNFWDEAKVRHNVLRNTPSTTSTAPALIRTPSCSTPSPPAGHSTALPPNPTTPSPIWTNNSSPACNPKSEPRKMSSNCPSTSPSSQPLPSRKPEKKTCSPSKSKKPGNTPSKPRATPTSS